MVTYQFKWPHFRPLFALTAIYILISTLFVASSFYFVCEFHLQVLVKDQWRIYYDYFTLPLLEAVTKPQNGHRIIFPGLVFLLDIHFFDAKNSPLIGLGLLLNSATASVFSYFVLRDRELSVSLKWVLISSIWLLFFWLASYVNLGLGNNAVYIYLVTFSVSIAIWAAVKAGEEAYTPSGTASVCLIGVGCLAATIASFSMGSGIMAWPTLLFCGYILGFRFSYFAWVLGSFALCVWLYLGPDGGVLSGETTADVFTVTKAAAFWLGAPLYHVVRWWRGVPGMDLEIVKSVVCPVLGGAALTATSVIVLCKLGQRRRLSQLESFLLSMTVFGVGVSFLGGVGRGLRLSSSPDWFFATRYVVWSMCFWASMLGLLVLYVHRIRVLRKLFLVLLVSGALILPFALWPSQVGFAGNLRKVGIGGRDAALGLVVGVQDDRFVRKFLFGDEDKVYEVAGQLRERRLNMFSDEKFLLMGERLYERFKEVSSKRCEGEVEKLSLFYDRGELAARMEGWAAWHESNEPTEIIVTDLDGRIQGLGRFESKRPGVSRRVSYPKPVGFFGYIKSYRGFDNHRLWVVQTNTASVCPLAVNQANIRMVPPV